jgi:hypothetical protein
LTQGKCGAKTNDHLLDFSQEQMEKAVHYKLTHEENNLTSFQTSCNGKHSGSRRNASGRRKEQRQRFLLQAASGQLTHGIYS